MSEWNAAEYLRFADERTRPAAELLARVPLQEVTSVVDLGCGPGNSTQLLQARYPRAEIVGVDDAPDMIATARNALPSVRFEQADLRDWRPETSPDLIFANAVLQWLPDHRTLMSRLAGMLAPGGCLAVQMPDNLDEPSHRLMREVASDRRWGEAIGDAASLRSRIASAGSYYDWLVEAGCTVDIWTTIYRHPLADAGAIVAWLSATGLRPFLARVPPLLQPEFLSAYEAALVDAYPRRADGRVLLAFPRMFIVGHRKS